MEQKKSLAQVFLKDKRYIQKILQALEIAGETVLEIGAGPGNISERIASRAKRLFCLEIDPRFCRLLEEKFKRYPNTQVIQADILKFPVAHLGKNIVVFANVPYQISAKLTKYLVKYRNCIDRAYLTFQKEFAEKLIAEPTQKQYCFLSCYLKYYAEVKKIMDIPAGAFLPRPKVNSSFIEINFYKKLPLKAKKEDLLFKIIRRAFSQRRKKIVNSLEAFLREKEISIVKHIKFNRRPGEISLEEYVYIADISSSQKN